MKPRMCSLERRFEYGDDWPIPENDLSILDTNRESLVELLDCSDLLTRLFSAQVINGRQRETISSESANYRRNEVLLDILRRCSINDYRQVIRCLHESNQSHVAELLDKGGGKFSTSLACCNIMYMYVGACVGLGYVCICDFILGPFFIVSYQRPTDVGMFKERALEPEVQNA